jgi:hypothetical protein
MKGLLVAAAALMGTTVAYAWDDTPQGFEKAYSDSVAMGTQLGAKFQPCPNKGAWTFMFFDVANTVVVLHDFDGAQAKSLCMADKTKTEEELFCSNADGAQWIQRLDEGQWHTTMHLRQAWAK